MTKFMHWFLDDDELARPILATVGIGAGVVLLGVALYAKYFRH